jgi:hypothetical protein
MFEYESTDRRGDRPPPGFEVMPTVELDPEQGREDRWLYHGRVGGRSQLRAGFKSRAEACRAAWIVSDAVRVRYGRSSDIGQAEFIVRRGTWDAMAASLIAQVIEDAGSIRRAARVLGLPKSTLARWVQWHKEHGSWPR